MNTTAATALDNELGDQPTLLGHPTGLFTLFFAEMWERFSYYGMRALLLYYMVNGFLKYDDGQAYGVYGAYGALVYATPYIGGMLADRLLGPRRAVVLGGLLMAAGHLVMVVEDQTAFFLALALLIVGNGFFKPNISTIVGGLYPKQSQKRDGGFTIFYMGINLGAAISPLLCGYVAHKYGWHYGFGLATVGMVLGLAVFVFPAGITRLLILLAAAATTAGLVISASGFYMTIVHYAIGAALLLAGGLAFIALSRGGLPKEAGAAKHPHCLSEPAMAKGRTRLIPLYVGAVLVATILLLTLVFTITPIELWSVLAIGAAMMAMPWLSAGLAIYVGTASAVPLLALLLQHSDVADVLLFVFGAIAIGSLIAEAFRAQRIERQRLFVVLVLMFFSMLFWAFFEQAGSSIGLFTERNVDRVSDTRHIETSDVGKTLTIALSQEQIGYDLGEGVFRQNHLQKRRDAEQEARATFETEMKSDSKKFATETPAQMAARGTTVIDVVVTDKLVGMAIAEAEAEVSPSVFQSVNPIFILILGPLFTLLWAFFARRKREPSTAVKFALGLAQLGLGFMALWYGAQTADERGMVWLGWLLLGYMLHTSGELCLSPVGLSMIVNLSPRRIVSTVMGAWFLATSISYILGAQVAKMTGVDFEAGTGDMPVPAETVHVYGDVFLMVGITVGIAAVLLLALAPLLTRWMHEGEVSEADAEEAANAS